MKLGEAHLAETNGGTHEAASVRRGPPAPRTWDLGHQAVRMESRQEAACLSGLETLGLMPRRKLGFQTLSLVG